MNTHPCPDSCQNYRTVIGDDEEECNICRLGLAYWQDGGIMTPKFPEECLKKEGTD